MWVELLENSQIAFSSDEICMISRSEKHPIAVQWITGAANRLVECNSIKHLIR